MSTRIQSPCKSIEKLDVYMLPKHKTMKNCIFVYSGSFILIKDLKTGMLFSNNLFKSAYFLIGKYGWTEDFLKCCLKLKAITRKDFEKHMLVVNLIKSISNIDTCIAIC